jgi:hypothetical protein
MKIAGIIAVVIFLILPGIMFALQGANILPGSVMTGQTQWLVIGSIMVIVGIGIIAFLQRRGDSA